MIKRSIMIAGRATSVSLEELFWKAFTEIADGRHMTPSELADEINAGRNTSSLSSAIRLFVLDFYQNQISAHQEKRDGLIETKQHRHLHAIKCGIRRRRRPAGTQRREQIADGVEVVIGHLIFRRVVLRRLGLDRHLEVFTVGITE